jgi:hypothetical protein
MAKLPRKCPSCSTTLEITRLTCPECKTEVCGHYQPDLFASLDANDFDFLVLFIKSKGNVKEMERELGISYWAIRSRLNEVVEQLGLEWEPAEAADTAAMGNPREQILEQLNDGLLTVEEAAARLEELQKRDRNRR